MNAAEQMSRTLDAAHNLWRVQRFEVLVIRPDHSFEAYDRIGGAAMDHTIEAMELGGIGARVSVKPVGTVELQ